MNSPTYPYRAVSVVPDILTQCSAAVEPRSKRFLSPEAPSLPLPNCSLPDGCQCKYKYWNDRRGMDRRALQGELTNHYFAGDDRRSGTNRREVVERRGAESQGAEDKRNGANRRFG